MWCPPRFVTWAVTFLLYNNDIINSSRLLYFILFADDTNLFYSNSNIDELTRIVIVNLELCELSKWFRENKLSLNVSKTNFLLFGSEYCHCNILNVNTQISIDGHDLERVSSTTFLGVYVDDRLN